MSPTEDALDPAMRAVVIEEVLAQIQQHYLHPGEALAVVASIRQRLSASAYDSITSAASMAETLTAHLWEASHDPHLCLLYPCPPRPVGGPQAPTSEEREGHRLQGLLDNFGFYKVERLPGNVGYLDMRRFFDLEFAAETAIAVMRFLASTEALIVDLRHNPGGEPGMVVLLCSYLFGAQPVHLFDFHWREGESIRVEQFWTLPYVPGPRYLSRPVYILTSRRTFSGAESFAYFLKNRRRATIIGERTRGGAHYAHGLIIAGLFGLSVPTAQPIDPLTGANWEGTGVIPDRDVPEEDALREAQIAALQQVLATAGEAHTGRPNLREEAEHALVKLRSAALPQS